MNFECIHDVILTLRKQKKESGHEVNQWQDESDKWQGQHNLFGKRNTLNSGISRRIMLLVISC